jgi:hypothetical protein
MSFELLTPRFIWGVVFCPQWNTQGFFDRIETEVVGAIFFLSILPN